MAPTPQATLRPAAGKVFVPQPRDLMADYPGNKAGYGDMFPALVGARAQQFPQVSAAAATPPVSIVSSLPNLGAKISLYLAKSALISMVNRRGRRLSPKFILFIGVPLRLK